MKIIIDTREQRPFGFTGQLYEGTTIEAGALAIGDYSLAGLADRVSVERKSLDDLVACLSRERDRFERELQRAAALDAFAIAIEATEADLLSGNYRSKMHPRSAYQSVVAFEARYRIPFHFANDRAGAEYYTHSFLKQYLQGAYKRLVAIQKAHSAANRTAVGLS